MSLLGTRLSDFTATAYRKGASDYVTVTQDDVLGRWSIFFFYPADQHLHAVDTEGRDFPLRTCHVTCGAGRWRNHAGWGPSGACLP